MIRKLNRRERRREAAIARHAAGDKNRVINLSRKKMKAVARRRAHRKIARASQQRQRAHR